MAVPPDNRATEPRPKPSALLLNHYRQCLQWRLELWLGGSPTVWLSEGSLDVHWQEREARLLFLPEGCRWRLLAGDFQAEGSFDRMSKRLRQLFTGHLR